MYKKNWWKVLGVVITIYVIVAGFMVPLNPGIIEVDPGSVNAGDEIELSVQGYNTRYTTDSENIRAWLKLDADHSIASENIEVISDQSIKVRFDLPEFLPTDKRIGDAVLVIDHPATGLAILPAAVFIKQDEINAKVGRASWNAPITDLNINSGFSFPFRNILQETIRNTYFHVAIWFAMFVLLVISVVYSAKYLKAPIIENDIIASSLVRVGILFGLIGVATGSLWAKSTWGTYWTNDTKLNMTAVALLIYLAYLVLRQSIPDQEQRARVASIYNIFAFAAMIPLLFVVPRLNDSLHPGNGGNPALGGEDLDNTMRMVFYPAIIAYTLMGLWISELAIRIQRLKFRQEYEDNENQE